MRHTPLFLLLCFFTISAAANQRMFEAIITVDSAGNAIKHKERLTVPDGWHVIEKIGGKSLVKDRNRIYNIYSDSYKYIRVRSTLDGIHWSTITTVNSDSTLLIRSQLPLEGINTNLFALGCSQSGSTRNVVVCWVSLTDSSYHVLASISSDSGKTFSEPTVIHKAVGCVYQYLSVAPDPNGGLYCMWATTRVSDSARYLWVSKTIDGGKSWLGAIPNIIKNNNAAYLFTSHSVDGVCCDDKSVFVLAPGDDLNLFKVTSNGTANTVVPFFGMESRFNFRYTSLYKDDDCNLHVFYSAASSPYSDYITTHQYSSDDGATWSDTTRLSFWRASDEYNEWNRPAVTLGPQGKIYVLTVDQHVASHLRLNTSTDNGKTWTQRTVLDSSYDTDVAPSIAYIGSKDGIDSLLIVWEDYRELPKSVYTLETVSFHAKVYPNPANEKIQIALEISEHQQLSFTITDVVGNQVYRKEQDLYSTGKHIVELPISQIHSSGVYLLRITSDKGEQTIQRIVVEK